ncbi:unnamed protein product [Polarella glacialis]|uniref:Uncharacterized protein n=1 Tax=Polarella glacialis TaxID=89957 RepID=A0A813LA52_POLGL|nr:unnamed protein product [Polarella glacialis]
MAKQKYGRLHIAFRSGHSHLSDFRSETPPVREAIERCRSTCESCGGERGKELELWGYVCVMCTRCVRVRLVSLRTAPGEGRVQRRKRALKKVRQQNKNARNTDKPGEADKATSL